MSDAVHQAGFRRGVTDDIGTTIQVNGCQNCTSPIAPAGHAAFWNPGFQVGANATSHHQTANSDFNHEGQSAIAIELTNMTLSVWAHQEGSVYPPGSAMPQSDVESNQDSPAYMRLLEDPVWRENVYLIDDTWDDEMVDASKAYLYNQKYTDLNVEFRGCSPPVMVLRLLQG